jgi:ankyrin repeat protein
LIEFCPELLKDSGLQSTLRTSGNMRGTVYPVFEAYLGKGGSNQQAYYSDLLRLALIDAAVDCDHGADRLRFLVKVGADVNAGQQAFTGDSPLAAAILWKCTANMQILLDHGAFVHADPASLGSESALHLAIRHWQGSLEACKVLLSYERVQVGREELCAAVDAGQLEWLQLVLGSQGNVKADEKQRSEWLKQAMLLAVERCSSDEFNDQQYVGIIKALLAPPAHWYPLPPDLLDVAVGEVLRVIQEEDVICGGAGAAVRVLGKAGADLDVNGGALWLAAAEYDSDEFLQALVEGGADLQKHGRAALRRAQSVRFATSLLRAGVPVSGDVAYEKEVLSLAVTAGPECEDIWSMLGALDKEGVVPKGKPGRGHC